MSRKIPKRVEKKQAKIEKGVLHDYDYKKPWGVYLTFVRNKKCTPKVLGIKDELSLQAHKNRAEIWYLASGKLAVYRGKVFPSKIKTIANLKEKILQPGDGLLIKKNTAHTAKNLSKDTSIIFEVQIGKAKEKDIIRFYDKNGRIKLKNVPDGLTTPEVIKFCRKIYK